jgi:hypothetical protein
MESEDTFFLKARHWTISRATWNRLLHQNEFEYHSPIYAYVSRVISFLLVFQLKSYMNFQHTPCKLHECQSHPSWFHKLNNTRWRAEVMKLIMNFFPSSYCFLFLRPKTLLSNLISNTFNLYSSFKVRYQASRRNKV